MSQKERNFQSKAHRGGQKFGSRPKSRDGERDKPYGRPASRNFSKGNERDRGSKPYDRDSRPPRRDRDQERDRAPAGERAYTKSKFGGERKKTFGDKGGFGGKPRRSFDGPDSRPPRQRDFGDKPYKKREFNDRDRRHSGDRPQRDFKPKSRANFGDKKPFNKEKRFDRPQKSFERHDERPTRTPQDTGRKLKSDRPSYGAPSSAYLFGVHAVTQALLNPKRVHQRLLCTAGGFESLQETWQDAQMNNIALPEVVTVEKEDLERLLPRDAVHQDVLLDCKPLEETFLADILLSAPDNAVVMLLDQVTDPHNVGAILRSAAAFGAIGVIMQKVHAPETTGTLAKSASGAVEHVPLIREVNLSRTLEQLKEAGFFCIGLAEEGKETLAQMNLTGKTALVMGAEGAGLRRLVAQNCDALAHLPTRPPIGSLNVSNAAAVALYELVRNG